MDIKTIKTLEDGMAGIKTEGTIAYVKKAREIQGQRGIFYTQWLLLKDNTDTIPLTVSLPSRKEEIPASAKDSNIRIDRSSLRKYIKKDGSQGIELKAGISNITIKQKENEAQTDTNQTYKNDRAIERPYIAAQVALKAVTELIIGNKIPLNEIEKWTEKLYILIQRLGFNGKTIEDKNENISEEISESEPKIQSQTEKKDQTEEKAQTDEITEEQINTIISYSEKIPNDTLEKLLGEVGVAYIDEIETSQKAQKFIELCKKEVDK